MPERWVYSFSRFQEKRGSAVKGWRIWTHKQTMCLNLSPIFATKRRENESTAVAAPCVLVIMCVRTHVARFRFIWKYTRYKWGSIEINAGSFWRASNGFLLRPHYVNLHYIFFVVIIYLFLSTCRVVEIVPKPPAVWQYVWFERPEAKLYVCRAIVCIQLCNTFEVFNTEYFIFSMCVCSPLMFVICVGVEKSLEYSIGCNFLGVSIMWKSYVSYLGLSWCHLKFLSAYVLYCIVLFKLR